MPSELPTSELPIWVLLVPANVDTARRDIGALWEEITGRTLGDTEFNWHAGEAGYCAVTASDPMLSEADYELAIGLSRTYSMAVFTTRPEAVYEYCEEGVDEFRSGERVAIHPDDPFDFAGSLGVRLPRPSWLPPQ